MPVAYNNHPTLSANEDATSTTMQIGAATQNTAVRTRSTIRI